MYCSSCGETVAQSLSYCNHCGAKLNGSKDDGVIKPELLVSAMAAVFILGLVAIAVLIGMARLVFHEPILLAITMFSFMLMLLVEGVFAWLLLRRKKNVSDTNRLNEQATKELYSAPTRTLTEPVPSVIEQTTNQLEPIYIDRKSK